ncbi:MAG: phage major capsid protein, partial [Ruminococcus sp.]
PTALLIPTVDIKPVAEWVDEDKGSDSQGFTTDKITFAGYKIECKTAFSLFMTKTALEIFESQFVNLVAEAMIKGIEKAIIVGTGKGSPKGILKETPPEGQAITVAKTGKLTYKLMCDAEAALPAAYDRGTVWLMTKKSFWSFIGITDDNGQPIARINAGIDGAPEYVLLGRHVCLTDGYMTSYADTVTEDTLFAAMFDLSYYVLNEIMGITLVRWIDNETSNTKLKAVMLADGKAVDIHSLVTLTKLAAA